jgi:hypothetical protein
MGNTNQLGFGSLASVAWTDMTGTDLTPDQLQAVNSDIDNFKIKSAVADGLTSFSLDDLEPAYFQITDVRTDTANKGDDRPVDWADYISGVTGNTLSSSQALSISEWRTLAAELQDHAALQASKRDPAGAGGGVKTVNGNWYINGQQLSLLDAYMAIRVNQVSNFDDVVGVYVTELNENNRLVRAANAWLSTLRAEKPTDNSATKAIDQSLRDTFSTTWGFDPVLTFQPKANPSLSGPATTWDTFIDDTKGYVDQKDTENQTVQQKLEQTTNRRSEVLDGLTSFAKAQTQTGSTFARNLG